jgi:raffinose synthase
MKYLPFLFLLVITAACIAQRTTLRLDKDGRLHIACNNMERLSNGEALLQNSRKTALKFRLVNDVAILWSPLTNTTLAANDYAGIFFDNLPNYKRGIALWRYKPWNSWTKPVPVHAASALPEDDVQFFYWQYNDGMYGAAVPMSGNGFRTTLGSIGNKWGSKAVSYHTNDTVNHVPGMALAFGKDPFELFERIYRTVLQETGKKDNLRTEKEFPEPFTYIGWCTWNASDNGKKLDDQLLLDAAKSFHDNKLPIGWMLVDDGWFQHSDRRLQSFEPNSRQFRNGFKPTIDILKKQYGIRYMGVWHTLNGLWNGIDPASSLGKRFASSLFTWTQREHADKEDSPLRTYHFIKPDSDSLHAFYNSWHRYLKQEGFDFVKVDNQLVVEKMAVNNYPIFTLADSMHRALNRSVKKYFNGAIINCMDMTADAYLNFGSTAIGRAVEDYFPYEPDESYDLQKGNAAAHVLQAVYNAIYFGQMVYPDFDIFQSHNPNAVFHAIARAINCGPIYITDKIGEQNFDLLRRLVYSDGKIIRSKSPLLPTEDCLFQVQSGKILKASSTVNNKGLLGIWNAADTDMVTGYYKPSDVRDIKGDDFVVYEYFSKKLRRAQRSDSFAVSLGRMEYQLNYILPVRNGFAALGLTEKYNGPATVLQEKWTHKKVSITLYEGGLFSAYSVNRPTKVVVNGKTINDFRFDEKKLTLTIEMRKNPVIEIFW